MYTNYYYISNIDTLITRGYLPIYKDGELIFLEKKMSVYTILVYVDSMYVELPRFSGYTGSIINFLYNQESSYLNIHKLCRIVLHKETAHIKHLSKQEFINLVPDSLENKNQVVKYKTFLKNHKIFEIVPCNFRDVLDEIKINLK